MLPAYGDKYDEDALFSPAEALAAQGDGVPDLPPGIVLGYQADLTEHVRERAGDPIEIVRSQQCYPLSETVGYVPVHEVGIGAPVSAIVTENVIAAGAAAVVMLGGSGSLQPDIPPDAAVLPTDAIRDEGVSYHYVPPEESVTPSGPLVDALDGALSGAGFETPRCPTWTTSAMYRETGAEIEQYAEEGVCTLCMESAAIWAVCAYRGVDSATVHQIGDYLTETAWQPDSADERGLAEMLDPVRSALTGHLDGRA